MIVSNSTPLIYLAKLRQLHLLKDLFQEILIPWEVQEEVVLQGKKLGQPDAFLVESAITAGWIKVEKVKALLNFDMEIDTGEIAAISLAKERKKEVVLIDEIAARTVAKLIGLEPRGTIFVLLLALKKKKITFDEFLNLLAQLAQQGFHLHEEIYTASIREAQRISKL